ncbi:MAG TPA: S8 family serine peptidase [Aquabacterium sp.]|nr:S8 family serine peptidase [Aquabacterium sp.]
MQVFRLLPSKGSFNGATGRASLSGTARARCVALAAAITCLGAMPALAAGPALSPEGAWARGRILVVPKSGLSDAALAKLLAAEGGSAQRIGRSNVHLVNLPGQASETAVAARLAHHPLLKSAEVDRLVNADFTANDPYAASQWHLAKVLAPTAWDSAQGSGVTIAVLDSGVEATHPDLAAQLVPGWNVFDNTAITADAKGHGTQVAGTAAASLNNAAGVASVAGKARIMPVRITAADGTTTYLSTVAQGITWAADNGARVANVSYSVAGSTAVQSAAQYMKDRNGLVFISAGNSNVDLGVAPSSAFIVVAATDANDAKASWSNFGNWVHLTAPGVSITTTSPGSSYASVSGTSFSSPLAAGVAALIMSANPALGSSQVESLLFATARDLGAAGRDPIFGWGRVDAAAAVSAALTTTSTRLTSDTQAPTVAIAAPLASSSVSGWTAVNVNASDNVGVAKVELRVNGKLVATDTAAPFAFSWDSTSVANGTASLVATAYDAAGNSAASSAVGVTVANVTASADTTPPVVRFTSPGSTVVSGSVTVASSASDDRGTTGLTQKLYINGSLVAQASGGSLSYKWNTTKLAKGSYTLSAVAKDAAGNSATTTLQVSR